MYCVKCGVELQKGAERCPLCSLPVYHPELTETPDAAPYPRSEGPETVSHWGLLFVLTFLFAIPLLICLLVDLQMNGGIHWSGYVALGLLAGYTAFCLPLWFKRPHPVIFFPVAVAAAEVLVLYICLKTGGRWFLPFALPVGGGAAALGETVIVLLRYAVRGRRHRILFIFGGATIGAGALCLLIEVLLRAAFALPMRWWSLYPLSALTLVGIMLIVIGLSRPLRESFHKKFFI